METITLKLTDMANGGVALGRDKKNRVIFVPFVIPGEVAKVSIAEANSRYAQGWPQEILEPSADRVAPRCAHFWEGVCSHFQHIAYSAQLTFKQQVIKDQLKRIGKLDAHVLPVLPSPLIWAYQHAVTLVPTAGGGMGLWSAAQQAVIPIDNCQLLTPPLRELMADFEIELPNLHRLTLRQGVEGDLLVAIETEDMDPPGLLVDFPVSVTIVLPDQTTANLIGDNYVIQKIGAREFQVSAGCYFYQNPAAAELLVDQVLSQAALDGSQTVLELYSGVGVLTAALAAQAKEVVGVEANADAVEDAAANLDDTQNVSLYQGFVEEALPALEIRPDVVILHPPDEGMSAEALDAVVKLVPRRIVYVGGDIATLARDGKRLAQSGYRLGDVQPVDMHPHMYQTPAVTVWRR